MREPQQDRSRATRRRLLEACVECLAEVGWSATTVAVVAERAGVSRGAAQHHFPTREDLITAALEHMFDERIDAARAELAGPGGGAGAAGGAAAGGTVAGGATRAAAAGGAASAASPPSTEAVVSRLVENFTGTLFKAALQVWTAAAADETLRRRVVPLEQKFGRHAYRMAIEALGVTDDDQTVHRLVQATLDLARGLGLADVLTDDSARRAEVVRAWSAHLDAVLRERLGRAG